MTDIGCFIVHAVSPGGYIFKFPSQYPVGECRCLYISNKNVDRVLLTEEDRVDEFDDSLMLNLFSDEFCCIVMDQEYFLSSF